MDELEELCSSGEHSEDFPRDVALAHTVPREMRAIESAWPLDADTYAAMDALLPNSASG